MSFSCDSAVTTHLTILRIPSALIDTVLGSLKECWQYSMENVDLAGILRDCMLPLVGSLPTDEWVRAFIDDESTLALLPRLATACKEWRDVVFELTRFVVLRVAMVDFMLLKPRGVSRVGSHSRKKEMAWIATKYEGAFFILSRSWALQVDVSERHATGTTFRPVELGAAKSLFEVAGGLGRHASGACSRSEVATKPSHVDHTLIACHLMLCFSGSTVSFISIFVAKHAPPIPSFSTLILRHLLHFVEMAILAPLAKLCSQHLK